MKIIVKNELKHLDRLNSQIMDYIKDSEIPKTVAFKLNLAIEEMVTNIINYGYEENCDEEISIDIHKENDMISVTIIDSAKPFNPLEKENPNTNAAIEDRQIGGLGIFFTKELTDDINYSRKNHQNILTFKIKINS